MITFLAFCMPLFYSLPFILNDISNTNFNNFTNITNITLSSLPKQLPLSPITLQDSKFYFQCIRRNSLIQDFYLTKPRYPSLCKINFTTSINIIENPKWSTNYELFIKFKKYDDSSLFTRQIKKK